MKQTFFLVILISISIQVASQQSRNPKDTNIIYHDKIEPRLDPVSNTLNFYSIENVESIDLIDTKGEIILKTSESEIGMDDLMNGIYFYRVKMHDGKTTEGKFLKE